MSKQMIEAFLKEMKGRYQEHIDAVALPEGTYEYVDELAQARDTETLLFMLKLGYLMGLQTGFAAAQSGAEGPNPSGAPGPLQA
ncbi:MAG TPA: hypothetical protein VKY42_00025 [Trueperaceae bacterium]|nr:hypothetical protein [Trueperaceae bacterium]